MARYTDTNRDHNPQADIEDLLAAVIDDLGPSFRSKLNAKQKAQAERVKAKRNGRNG